MKKYPIIVDATCGVIAAVNDKRVFYFAIIIHNGLIKTEPIPVFQFLTDKPNEQSFSSSLHSDKLAIYILDKYDGLIMPLV